MSHLMAQDEPESVDGVFVDGISGDKSVEIVFALREVSRPLSDSKCQ
jgi:hypothetical protein